MIPLAPEAIVKQDGATKNDCERNVAKRLLRKFRQEHLLLKVIVIEDDLASNAPHIRLLQELDMRFVLVVKEDDHQYLFKEVLRAYDDCLDHGSGSHRGKRSAKASRQNKLTISSCGWSDNVAQSPYT